MELAIFVCGVGVFVFCVAAYLLITKGDSVSKNGQPPISAEQYRVSSLPRPVPKRTTSQVDGTHSNSKNTASATPVASTTDDGFVTSMAIGYLTDNALLGGIVGGNIAGGIIGDMLNGGTVDYGSSHSHTPDPSPSYDSTPSVSYDSGSSSFDGGSGLGF